MEYFKVVIKYQIWSFCVDVEYMKNITDNGHSFSKRMKKERGANIINLVLDQACNINL